MPTSASEADDSSLSGERRSAMSQVERDPRLSFYEVADITGGAACVMREPVWNFERVIAPLGVPSQRRRRPDQRPASSPRRSSGRAATRLGGLSSDSYRDARGAYWVTVMA